GPSSVVSGVAYPLLRLSAWSASLALPTARTNMLSADSCATVGSPLDFPSSNNTGTMAQASPGKLDRLHRTPAGSTALALMDVDFAISGPLVRPRMPHIRFLFVRSRLCSTLPSNAFARPCAWLVLHLHRVGRGTLTPKLSNMPGTPLGRRNGRSK